MYKDYKITQPFFEFGPKCYMYGERLLRAMHARFVDAVAEIG